MHSYRLWGKKVTVLRKIWGWTFAHNFLWGQDTDQPTQALDSRQKVLSNEPKIFFSKKKFFGRSFFRYDLTLGRDSERFPTFPNFFRLDPDRAGQSLQFAIYGALEVDWGKKILRNYEKNMTKIENLRSKNVFFKFREYVSRTLLQGLQPPTNISLIFKRFLNTLGSALLSLSLRQVFGWFQSLGGSRVWLVRL